MNPITDKKSEEKSESYIKVPIYLAVDDKTRHWAYFRQMPRSSEERKASIHKEDYGGGTVNREIKVYDGRGNIELKFDDASFELVDCPTQLSTSDFYKLQGGDTDLKDKYYKEIEEYVKRKLGCDKVVCIHSQVRNASKIDEDDGVAGYAGGGPHTDSSPVSSDQLAISLNPENTKYERYCYANLWRNIADTPIENNHLAMLDERTTVKPDDYITRDLFGDGYDVVQYGLNARHAESTHKWYYFPGMTKNEGILFKQMDSDWTKKGRICFHMSVEEEKKESSPPRESIELRFVCYWEKAAFDTMPTEENTNAKLIKNPVDLSNAPVVGLNETSSLRLIIELVIRYISFISFGFLVFGKSKEKSNYSGNPKDYLDQFLKTVDSYPSWPTFAQTWVKGQMKQGGKEPEKGIAAITKELVNDTMGYQKTKNFATGEKEEIVKFLLADPDFTKVSKKHWAALCA